MQAEQPETANPATECQAAPEPEPAAHQPDAQEQPPKGEWVTTNIHPEPERFASHAQRQTEDVVVVRSEAASANPVPILYEDNHLLVVQKPCNMPTQEDSSGDLDLFRYCKEDLRTRHHKPGEAYLGLVHRLDRPVGGVVALAKTSKAAARLSAQLRNKQMRREYLAIVYQTPQALRGELRDYLIKDRDKNMVSVASPRNPDAKLAILHYTVLAQTQELSLLAIRIDTGRAHQIRVQLANIGHPIWGDQRYGSPRPGNQIALWAYKLTLQHPTTKQSMQFVSPTPHTVPWELFTDHIPRR